MALLFDRAILLIVAIVLCEFSLLTNGQEHNIRQCPNPQKTDKLICEKNVKDSPRLFPVIRESVVCPEHGLNVLEISCIIVTSRLEGGGVAEIVSGGVGHTSVEIALTSYGLRGLDYEIEVYAKSPENENTSKPT